MPELAAALAECLARVQRPGAFYATGTFDIHPPRLEIEGVGPIALPLQSAQAGQLKSVAEQAPYGRGTETLVDTQVRRTWQIDAERMRITGRRWAEDLASVVARITATFGITGRVEAELYKLLVYEEGSFFLSHRDTEKSHGMFATLVVVLPGDFEGGELVVRHRGQEVRLDLHRDEPSEAAFAAFYADCLHEVLPIHSGHRLTLIYNLIRPQGEPLPQLPDYDAEQAQATDLLRAWGRALDASQDPAAAVPLKLVYPLEHAYTPAELGFDTLKGADAAVAAVVSAAARAADCDLFLALASVEESGWAESTGDWHDPDFEIGEVDESNESLHDWRHPDGTRPAMGALPFFGDEVAPPGAFEARDDSEPEFSEATGNAGASFERLYQCAALVLWPRTNRAAVLAAGGLAVSLPFLDELVRQWQAAGQAPEDPLRTEARALAARISAAWPTDDWARQHASGAGQTRMLLDALARLDDPECAAVFVAGQSAAGAYGPQDNESLAAMLARLPTARAADLLAAIVAGNAGRQPAACADLLARVSADPAGDPEPWRAAALALLAALTTEAQPPAGPDNRFVDPRQRRAPPTPDLVVQTLTALARIDSSLADRALDHFMADSVRYGMDGILLPAALILKAATATGPRPTAIDALLKATRAHLDQRIAEPLEPPADLSRPAKLSCSCNYCQGLSRFLASPMESVWKLKAAEGERTHVTEVARRSNSDLDLATDKKGRPYTLVCTKNQASYERRVRQRAQDLEQRGRLGD
ncbi:2OG-Fe(II) oxygenase [uncultured Thiodictyon sp.]|jgi:predicted 2-oxoglutarate/Fe(II)-dependent dioxygenase YbiX|uniref:2OG-Fe(II) oxygenase n=1 Tax=uncultured Thiodictyon sp. TaxID=1846217 RepID=UPI0025DFD284|nr:2OG-Fe(II) oxygenase [uncultured Thiodictyon sp.]